MVLLSAQIHSRSPQIHRPGSLRGFCRRRASTDYRGGVRLVAIGDSTVEGLEDPRPDGTYRGWADHLAGHLARRHEGLTYANLAIRGRLAREVRAEQLPPALEMSPDV